MADPAYHYSQTSRFSADDVAETISKRAKITLEGTIKSDAGWKRLQARSEAGILLRRAMMEARPGGERARIERERETIAKARASKPGQTRYFKRVEGELVEV